MAIYISDKHLSYLSPFRSDKCDNRLTDYPICFSYKDQSFYEKGLMKLASKWQHYTDNSRPF